ncbi:hypothetical protein [Streptomyces sp. NRRL S-37]|uniref:hypothetical protein n=1 Tax=Streptomyces sp. NRRL S-37 TaxID=1463903 RepID=UPI00131DB15B|nr:hypothetical protein [Streptomyces sp. NRRL S-37]
MPEQTSLRDTVLSRAARILEVAPGELRTQPALDAHPTFSSFRMVDLVEELEQDLDVTFDAADLTIDNLRHLDRLTDLAARAVEARTTQAV